MTPENIKQGMSNIIANLGEIPAYFVVQHSTDLNGIPNEKYKITSLDCKKSGEYIFTTTDPIMNYEIGFNEKDESYFTIDDISSICTQVTKRKPVGSKIDKEISRSYLVFLKLQTTENPQTYTINVGEE